MLEDDCLPNPTFFEFCRILLDHYRLDRRVAVISGTNFQFSPASGEASYFFSRYPLTWGWAAWRRSWEPYDRNLDAWERLRHTTWLSELLADPLAAAYWRGLFDEVRRGVDTWDYSFVFSCWRAGALAVHPDRNLVTNAGFGPDATHTRDVRSIFANMPVRAMSFPLIHPEKVERAVAQDERTERIAFSGTVEQRLRQVRDQLRARPERPG